MNWQDLNHLAGIGKMIVLREYSDADLARLVSLANNQNVARYLVYTFPHPYKTADGEWWIATGSKQNGAITRVIEFNGLFVGSIGINPQGGWRNHLGEIGYWVAEDHWGKGIATAALTHMTKYAFTHRQFRKLYAPVLSPNTASMKVLEKCGYLREAILKAEVQKDGTFYDIHQFALQR